MRYQVLSLVDQEGDTVSDFKKATTVMLYHLGHQYSQPASVKKFQKPVKVNDIVEVEE